MNAESKNNKPRLSNAQVKQYRALAHQLNPIVTIAGAGLSEGVRLELDRALRDHELIKIKIAVGDREARDALIDELCDRCKAVLIQRIGHTATLLRRNPQADPRKSNLMRSQ
jgi:RNA-binding protein